MLNDKHEDQMKMYVFLLTLISNMFIIAIIIAALSLLFCGCTISLNNVNTHGTAQDIVDDTQHVDPEITTDLKTSGPL
jgi:hypothetical protein